MKQRNVRRRRASRYLRREAKAGRWWYFKQSTGAECQAYGHSASWHRRFPFRIYGGGDE